MAKIYITDFDDHLYQILEALARAQKRSVKDEATRILTQYLSQSALSPDEATRAFLELEWYGNETADQLLGNIRKARIQS